MLIWMLIAGEKMLGSLCSFLDWIIISFNSVPNAVPTRADETQPGLILMDGTISCSSKWRKLKRK